MIFYGERNVYEAAKDRMRYIFREFYGKRNIMVTMSGGKDSTVVLYLAKEIMDEMGIEKIPVLFLDQEAETPMTVEYVRYIMHLPWVEPYWVQTYFQEWNSSKGDWFNVWGPGEKWCREKEPDNPYGEIPLTVNRYFKETLWCAQRTLFGKDFISLGGVRIEESPSRLTALCNNEVFPGITWGKGGGTYKDGTSRGAVLYPIWDWRVNDVWYYILSNHIKYNRLYNYLFTTRPLRDCRVSSLIHENSIQEIKVIKEVSPEFYDKLMARVEDVNTTVHTLDNLTAYVNNLPPYFASWEEYVRYLCDHICRGKKEGDTLFRNYMSIKKDELKDVGAWEEGRQHVEEWAGRSAAICCVAEDYLCSKMKNSERSLYEYIRHHYKEIQEANKKENEHTGQH